LNELDLVATSAADDAAFVALQDVAALLGRPEYDHALLIGGHMVSLHARRWGLPLFRETQDADLGVPQLALNSSEIRPHMEALGYVRVRANRFAKRMPDDPTGSSDGASNLEAIIDILVPALTNHARKNVTVGDVTTIEVPGLAEALNQTPVVLLVNLRRRSGAMSQVSLRIPCAPAALVLKALAWDARRERKDAIDVWRCLEVATAAHVRPNDLASADAVRAMSIIEKAFRSDRGEGVALLGQGLNEAERTARATRLRALIARLHA
jgi:hypothetical protein